MDLEHLRWVAKNRERKYDKTDVALLGCIDEIGRLRLILFKSADCDPERDRSDCWEAGDCQNCSFWAFDNHCDVDGWKPE